MSRSAPSRSSPRVPVAASVALHVAAVVALASFHYPAPADRAAWFEITVVAAADQTAPLNGAAPVQDAAIPEPPIPTAAVPDEPAPVPIEAAQVMQPLPKEAVPHVPAPPEPGQIGVASLPAAAQIPPPAVKVAPNRPRVVKAAAHVAPPPTPLPQGEGEARASPAVAGGQQIADALSAWQRALIAWLDAHRVYPEAARRVGEQGAVGVRFSLNETGDVTGADIQRGSGSTTLDDATLEMLRGAHLPAPPPGTDPARRTISVSIRYRLN
jgi:protein TonB